MKEGSGFRNQCTCYSRRVRFFQVRQKYGVFIFMQELVQNMCFAYWQYCLKEASSSLRISLMPASARVIIELITLVFLLLLRGWQDRSEEMQERVTSEELVSRECNQQWLEQHASIMLASVGKIFCLRENLIRITGHFFQQSQSIHLCSVTFNLRLAVSTLQTRGHWHPMRWDGMSSFATQAQWNDNEYDIKC